MSKVGDMFEKAQNQELELKEVEEFELEQQRDDELIKKVDERFKK